MKRTRLARSTRTIAAVLAIVGVMASIAAGAALASSRDRRIDDWLKERGRVVEAAAQATVKTAADGLTSVVAYLEHSDVVTPAEFTGFTDTLDPSIGLFAIGYVAVVTEQEKDAYVTERRLADPDFEITRLAEDGRLVSAAAFQGLYFPIERMNPGALLDQPLAEAEINVLPQSAGFDVGSETAWRPSLQLAVERDEITVSSFVDIELDGVVLGSAVLVAVPVHDESGSVVGLVIAPLLDNLLATPLDGMTPTAVSWTIETWDGVPDEPEGPSWSTLMVLPGAVWKLRVDPTPAALASLGGVPPWMVVVGLLAVTLLVVIAFVLVAQRAAQRSQMSELERIGAEKDRFLASVAHEIRTPLTVVSGLADELRRRPGAFDPDEAAELLDLVCEQSEEVAAIVEDLLVAARADLGMVTVNLSPVDLRLEAASVVGDADVRMPETTVWAWADPQRVRQIIRNLVSNAERYGGPEVEVRCGTAEGSAWVEVADSGPPIPHGARDEIFEAYVSSASNSDPGVAAIGLGLFISQRLSVLLDGELTYHHDGRFGVFRLTLPSAPVVEKQVETAA